MKAAIYVRVSGPDNPGVATIDSQASATKKRLEELGYEVVKVYEEHYPGDVLWERPVLSSLRAEVAAGNYQAILFEEADRYKCKIFSATEDFENSKEGELIRTIRAYVAEVEHSKIKDRVNRGRAALKAQRKPVPNGSPRFGYNWDRKNRAYVVDETTAATVRDIFRLCLSGTAAKPRPFSCYAIASHLNSVGVDCPSVAHGRKSKTKPIWRASTVRLMIRDGRYKGDRQQFHKFRSTGDRTATGRPVVEAVPQDEWVEAADDCPVLVDATTWEAAQKVVTEGKTGSRAETMNVDRPILLRGFVKCRVCGKSMHPYPMKIHRKGDGVT